MSTDKIGELDQAIADIFRESRVASVKARPSLSDFDHGTLADIFNDSVSVSSGPEPSPSRLDHRTLAEIFGEPSRAQIDPPSLDMDESSSPPLFGEDRNGEVATHHRMAERTAPTAPESVQPHRAESLLAKIRYIFTPKTDARPHEPPIAAVRAPREEEETHRDVSPLGIEPGSLLFRPVDQAGDRRPTTDGVAVTPETPISQTSSPAPPSLAEIISSVSSDFQPPLPVTDNQTLPPIAKIGPDDEYPAADAETTQDGEDSWQQLESLLTERGLSAFPAALPQSSPRETTRPPELQQSPERGAGAAYAESREFATAPADATSRTAIEEKTSLQQAGDTAQDEIGGSQSGDADEIEGIAADPSDKAESAPPQQATSLHIEPPLSAPTEPSVSSPILVEVPPRPEICGPPVDPEHAAIPASIATADGDRIAETQSHEATPLQPPASLLRSETESAALSNEPGHIDPVAEIATEIVSDDAESTDREPLPTSAQPSRSDLSSTRSGAVVDPTPEAGPYRIQVAGTQAYRATLPPLRELPSGLSLNVAGERLPVSHGVRPDRVEPASQVATVDLPIAPQSTLPSRAPSLPAEAPVAGSQAFNDSVPLETTRPLPNLDDPRNVDAGSTTQAIGLAPATLDEVAQEPRSLLSELDLESAIRLRWVMRDIRAHRLGMSPARESDLAALAELGLVEIRGALPYLTASGVRELN